MVSMSGENEGQLRRIDDRGEAFDEFRAAGATGENDDHRESPGNNGVVK
jgi:hypothetical protein